MHIVIAIYFAYLSGTVCRDRPQPENEGKSSRADHFIVFVLQKIIEIPALAPNMCMFLHITSYPYMKVPHTTVTRSLFC